MHFSVSTDLFSGHNTWNMGDAAEPAAGVEEKLRRFPGGLEDGDKYGKLLVYAVLVLGLVLLLTVSLNGVRTSLVFNETAELENIQGNRIGVLRVYRSSMLPAYYNPPDVTACVYTSADRAPVILRSETEPGVVFTRFTERNLTVSIPEDKLGEPGIDGRKNVTQAGNCPVRSRPRIVVVKD